MRLSFPTASASMLLVLAALLLPGCSSFNATTERLSSVVTPYKVEIVQGNFVSSEQVALLRPGMSRLQVREMLGTPLLVSVFHADRWDYVFTLKRQGAAEQQRRLSVFFEGDVLKRFEGDEMPSETEFAAALQSGRQLGKVPKLDATPEELEKVNKPRASGAAPAAPVVPTLPASYPPLETSVR